MPLSGTGSILGLALATDIANEFQLPAPTPTEIQLWTVVANRLILHITANALVNHTGTVIIPPSGVATILAPTPAGPAPCTGTATGNETGTGTIS